jgi:hypothetical protein
MKLVHMPTTFSCTKLHLFKCNGSWVTSIKQNTDFNLQQPAMFVFFCPTKVVFVHPVNTYQNTKFDGHMLTGASFVSTSEVWKSAILEWLKLRD